MQDNRPPIRRLLPILLILLLAGTFVLTVYASSRITREVKENYFQTGEININLNDGKAVITPEEFNFEPGVTVVKPFFVRNEGTCDVYYKVYFQDVEGELGDVLEITIRDEAGNALFTGTLSGMNRRSVKSADDILELGETKDMTITFHFPEERGNETQDTYVSFVMCAEAVQTKNNPNKEF